MIEIHIAELRLSDFIQKGGVILKRKIGVMMLVMFLIASQALVVGAQSKWSDMDDSHWANSAVMRMADLGILGGYADGTFRPDNDVSRDEFATMMVRTLQLDVSQGVKSSFSDVADNYWALPYIEAAKGYLTGYLNSQGQYTFKPSAKAVREDMAVALVKALGYSIDSANLSLLDDYTDAGNISDNLKPYVALAIENGLMSGVVDADGNKTFSPMSDITRAEAAALLVNVIDEEKITFDEEKVILDPNEIKESDDDKDLDEDNDDDKDRDDDHDAYNKDNPFDDGSYKLSIRRQGNQLFLSWTPYTGSDFSMYKIVASESDRTPMYPENGYYKYYTDKSVTSAVLEVGQAYTNGDFKKFERDESYYFSITYVLDNGRKVSNTLEAEWED